MESNPPQERRVGARRICHYFVVDNILLLVDNKSMARMGRPKKPPKERQSVQIAIRVTAAQFGKLKRSAGKLTVSEYIRKQLGIRGDE
jgi:hypothetical protein